MELAALHGPENGLALHGGVQQVSDILKAEIAAPDADTVVFTLNRPSSVFLAGIARNQCGQTAIIARSSFNPDGSFKAPVGTGPFRFGE